jgi:hypothetical protein
MAAGGDTEQTRYVLRVGSLILAMIGVALALFTRVSLATGTGTVWLGFVLTVVAAIGMFALNASNMLRLIGVVLAVIALVSALYDEHQLDNKRHQIEQILGP